MDKDDEMDDVAPTTDKEYDDLEKQRKVNKRIHPVKDYSDTENMWEKLVNLEKCATCPPTQHKYTNNRNRYTI